MHGDRNEAGKVFVGGLSWDTTRETLLSYFSQYGEVVDCVVMKNPQTGKSRGFGFVTYKDPSTVEIILSVKCHIVDGRQVDPKACNPKGAPKQPRGQKGADPYKDKKVFIGGLPGNVDEEVLKSFFGRYGTVVDVTIMYDAEKQRSRGFGFLTFENEDSVEQLCSEHYVNLNGKRVECKKAEPRDGRSREKQQEMIGMPPGGPEMGGMPPGQMEAPWGGDGPPGNWNPMPPQNIAESPQGFGMPPGMQGGYQDAAGGAFQGGWPGPQPGQQPGGYPGPGGPGAGALYGQPSQPPSMSGAPGAPGGPAGAPGAPTYQWSSGPGVPSSTGQPPVGQAPQAMAAPVAYGNPYGAPQPGGQPPAQYINGQPVSQAAPTTVYGYGVGAPQPAGGAAPTDPYGQPGAGPQPTTPGQAPAAPAGMPGYGNPVPQPAAGGPPADPAAVQGKPVDYGAYYPNYAPAVQYPSDTSAPTPQVQQHSTTQGTYPQGGAGYTPLPSAPAPGLTPGQGYGSEPAGAAAYGSPPPPQQYGDSQAPGAAYGGGAPGPSPGYQRQGGGAQGYHPYRR